MNPLLKAHYQKITSLGGQARAKNLTAEQRREIARKAAKTRWEKEPPKKK